MSPPFQLLELNVISAQDLAPVGRNMRAYAVSWLHPDRKLSTRVDTQGQTQPTWNDKFVFRVDEEFLYSDTSAITIHIYALHWFKDIHVGTVRVLLANLLPPPADPNHRAPLAMRFVALQVRRPSGRPQGILNIAFSLLDTSMRSMPLYNHNASALGYRHLMGEKDAYHTHNHLFPSPKPDLRRTKSDTSSMLAPRPLADKDKPNSASQLSVKGKTKKSNSVISTGTGKENSSVLSDTVLPWKVKSGKASPNPDDILHIDPPLNSPAPQFMPSPAPKYKSSPAPQYMPSPKPQFKNSPAPQYMASPAPQFRNSPKPQFLNSPKPQFKNSPMPQYMASPKPQFKNSPKPQYMASPAVAQFRSSPAVSKFHPAVGYGGSRRGTPLHPLAKGSGGFEYMTPRRSNLGNMGPVMMTESELGPSPSEVAAAIARNPVIDDGEDSTVGGWSLAESVEGLQSKMERWRTELPPVIDQGELSSFPTSSKTSTKASVKSSRHSRRHTDGGSGGGLFSCFSNICGVECSIVCGGDPKGKKKKKQLRRRASSAGGNTSLV
uniref:Signal transducer and activator of transcription 2 n=1 Tax=Cajanus cajan TaxID=3821 RepID=A0A151T196_CAJCA|nr:Signal transducer and activator of transcription 2 [Cajanus cajan]